jgi:hypothetical protein
LKANISKALVISLILASMFLFTFPVSLVPVDRVFAASTESFALINGVLLSTNHPPSSSMLGPSFFKNIKININGGLVKAHYSLPSTFSDTNSSYDCIVTINMEGTYSSDAGMKGRYEILVTGSAVYQGKPSSVNFSPSGPFSGTGGLVIGKTVTINFGKAVGPPAAMFGETINADLDPFDVSFTVSKGVDAPPGPVVKSLPQISGEPIAFIENIEGTGPVYISNESEDVPPSQRNWVIATPKMSLGKNYSVRTGNGAEVLLRYSTGAVSRTRAGSSFTITERTDAKTSVTSVWTRLVQGISNFYYPKNQEGADKFGVETDRAVTSIKGTNFVLEVSNTQTLLKVIEGVVDFASKQSGQSATVEAGQTMAAADSGLGQKTAFNADAEKANWGDMTLPDSSSPDTSSNPQKKITISMPKCPITAALAVEPTSPKLTIFRNFRDKVLARSDIGKAFVNLYYGTGTWVVDNVLSNNAARLLTRQAVLEPLSLALTSSAFIWNN